MIVKLYKSSQALDRLSTILKGHMNTIQRINNTALHCYHPKNAILRHFYRHVSPCRRYTLEASDSILPYHAQFYLASPPRPFYLQMQKQLLKQILRNLIINLHKINDMCHYSTVPKYCAPKIKH